MAIDKEQSTDRSTGKASSFLSRSPVALSCLGLALGLCVEFLFHGQAIGISFPLWAGIGIAALSGAAVLERVRPARGSLWLAVPILFLASFVAWRTEPLTVFLDILLTLSLFALWVRTFRTGRLLDFGWLDFAVAQLWVPLEAWIRPWGILGASQQRLLQGRERQGRILAILRGGLLAFPVLIIFVALLSSADLVFGDLVERALDWLDLERFFEFLESALVVLLSAVFLLGALVAALRDPGEHNLIGYRKPLVVPFLGFTEAAIVLAAVDILFVSFVAIQFRYLFGGEANISAAGYTYSEYARRGFGELVATAILTLGLVMALANWTQRRAKSRRAWFNGLSGLLVGMISVMLASAFLRLLLYEHAFGFTRLRIYTHVAIVWMGLLFLVFFGLLLREDLRRFAPAVALGTLGFAATLNLLKVDQFIVDQNVARWAETGKIDAPYLTTLTDEALPSIVAFADNAAEKEQEVLLPWLACRRAQLKDRNRRFGWPSFHLGHRLALDSLEAVQDSLADYSVVRRGSGSFEVQIDGEAQPCSIAGF